MYAEGHRRRVRRLPNYLLDAVRAFDRNAVSEDLLGAEFSSASVKLKMQEWDAYSRHPSDRERERETSLDI